MSKLLLHCNKKGEKMNNKKEMIKYLISGSLLTILAMGIIGKGSDIIKMTNHNGFNFLSSEHRGYNNNHMNNDNNEHNSNRDSNMSNSNDRHMNNNDDMYINCDNNFRNEKSYENNSRHKGDFNYNNTDRNCNN